MAGELRVMFGRNGVGKSTLLRIAAGLTAADGGSVHFDGECYVAPRLATLAAEGLFFLPDHDLLSPALSVRHNLELFQQRFAGADVLESACIAGIERHLDRRPRELSGGELRRAELAAVLVRRPRCVLADEPYRGISPVDHEHLTWTLRHLAAQGAAVVVTGHEVPTLLDAADHITWCTSGTTYELGPPAAALAHDRFRAEYLGLPMRQ
jgi:ABC-type multidrug transport system ATPase subunit